MKVLRTTLLSALAVTCGLSSVSHGDDWTGFRGPKRDGKSAEKIAWAKIAKSGPKLDWICEGLGEGYASVSVADNFLYTTGNQDGVQTVSAVDTTSGTRLWVTKLTENVPQHGYEGSRSTPTIDGDRLYLVASDGRIVSIDRKTGDIVWQRPFSDFGGKMMSGWGFSESPLIDGDLVLCTPGGAEAMVVALKKSDGTEVWRTALPDPTEVEQDKAKRNLSNGAGYASIVISNGGKVKQYVTLVGLGVIGVRASDGKLLWRYNGTANAVANIPTPVVDGDYVFTSTAYGIGSALLKLSPAGKDEVKMEEVYFQEAKNIQNKQGGMVLIDGHIFCGHGDGQGMPICIDLKTGKKTWGPIRGAGSGESSVIYADGHILYRFQDGTITVVKANPKKYEVVLTFKPEYQERESWAYPVIANGKLYLREQAKLMSYDLSAE